MKEEDLKKYQETVAKIKKIFGWELELKKVFGSRIDKVKGVFELLQRQMNELTEDKAVEASGEEKSRVREVADLFLSIAVNEPIVPIFRDLSRLYLLLMFNWNKELGKRGDIGKQISTAEKIVTAQMTMFDTIDLLKYLLKQGRNMRNWSPPAFELSRHYLESLDNEGKGEEGTKLEGKVEK